MKNKILSYLLVLTLLIGFSSCLRNVHQVGQGAQGNNVAKTKQLYFLNGLIRLNRVDTDKLANNSKDYTITTEFDVVDSIITGTIGSIIGLRTVKVTY